MQLTNSSWHSGHSALQRRSTVSNLAQAGLDAVIVLALAFQLELAFIDALSTEKILFLLVLLATMAVTYDSVGLYRRNRSLIRKSIDLFKAWFFALIIALGVVYVIGAVAQFPSDLIIEFAVLVYLVQLAAHQLIRICMRKFANTARIKAIVVGPEAFAVELQQNINGNPWLRERVVDILPLDLDASAAQWNAITLAQALESKIKEQGLKSVYFSLPFEMTERVLPVLGCVSQLNVDVHWLPDFSALKLVNPSIKEVAGNPVVTLSETPLIGLHHFKKSLFDKTVALFAIVAVSPILLLTALAIKLESKGPVLFRQHRAGWDGEPFAIWKFRSMCENANPEGQVIQTTKNDARVTRVGRFIRKTSIDELPQLFNVLNGTMSLVGPRPHAIEHDSLYSQQIDAYLSRHRIKPGITGLAQVRGLRGETETLDLMEQRVGADLEYINRWSLLLDVEILFRTVLTLLSNRAY